MIQYGKAGGYLAIGDSISRGCGADGFYIGPNGEYQPDGEGQYGDYSIRNVEGCVPYQIAQAVGCVAPYDMAAAENDDIPASVTYTIESTDPIPAVSSEGYALGGWIVSVGGGNWTQGATLEADYVTMLPVFAAREYINRGELAALHIPEVELQQWSQLVYLKGKAITPQMQMFMNTVLELLPPIRQ